MHQCSFNDLSNFLAGGILVKAQDGDFRSCSFFSRKSELIDGVGVVIEVIREGFPGAWQGSR